MAPPRKWSSNKIRPSGAQFLSSSPRSSSSRPSGASPPRSSPSRPLGAQSSSSRPRSARKDHVALASVLEEPSRSTSRSASDESSEPSPQIGSGELRDLHDALFKNRWDEADEFMRLHPSLVVEQLPDNHKGNGGCALHAVSHRPAPSWLQRKVLRTVADERPELINVACGKARTTPLHLAIASKQPEDSVRELIKAKADLNAENRNQKTPLDLASCSSSRELETLLEKCGAKRNGPRIYNPGMGKRRYWEQQQK